MSQTVVTVKRPARPLTSISFLAAIFLFFLPFVEIRCNGQSFASNTGFGLATGRDYKTVDFDLPGGMDKGDAKTEKQEGKMYYAALAALGLGLLGLIFSLMRGTNRFSGWMGLLAVVAMIVLMIQLKSDLKKESGSQKGNDMEQVKVEAVFTEWFYISAGFFVIAFFSSNRKQKPETKPAELV
jgi:hypothetical protein